MLPLEFILLRRLLFALLALSVVACDTPQPAPKPASTAVVPKASPLPAVVGPIPTADPAAHVFLWGNAATTQRDLTLARDGGFTWVKQRFEWRNIEKVGKGQFEWQEPDRIVQAVADAGLRVVARVDNQPQWATRNVTFPASEAPAAMTEWTDYLTALATRYKGKIHAYEIWNEPNLAREWGGKPDPAAYATMLKASYTAIKAADPQALVITAGMSPTTDSSDNAMRDMDFYRGMYTAGSKGSYDVLGAHAPGFKAEPCLDPAQVAADPALTNNDPSSPELKRIYAFRHVEDVRALMVAQGEADKQLAVMEMGWTTDDRPNSDYRWHAVSADDQGKNLVAAFECAKQRMSPWLGLMTVIYIADPTWTPALEQFHWAITRPNGEPRPAYTALKQVLKR